MLVSAAGSVIATGYSRERDPADHAEEVALAKAAAAGPLLAGPGQATEPPGQATGPLGQATGPPGQATDALRRTTGQDLLAGATLYSSLEPCLRRASRPRPCAELIVAAGVRRVAVAWLEPSLFVPGGGAAWLRDAGVTVIELPELTAEARAVNAHLLAD